MADKAYKGVVRSTYGKDWVDRETGEDIVLLSFRIDGENKYFRHGTTEVPAIKEGNYISFVADARGNVDISSVEEARGTPPVQAPKPKAKSSGGVSRDDYWANKEAHDQTVREPRIAYSAAQKNATELVTAALAHDLLSFGNAAKGKRLDMMADYVDQLTLRLAANQINGHKLIEEYMESVNDE